MLEDIYYDKNIQLHELLKEYNPSEIKVVEYIEQHYAIPKKEFESKSKKDLIFYIKEHGVKIAAEQETWNALKYPIPCLITRKKSPKRFFTKKKNKFHHLPNLKRI